MTLIEQVFVVAFIVFIAIVFLCVFQAYIEFKGDTKRKGKH